MYRSATPAPSVSLVFALVAALGGCANDEGGALGESDAHGDCPRLMPDCQSGADAGPGDDPEGVPPGPDTTEPYPIDRGDDGPETPGTYKGLWQRLVDNGEPAVTAVDGVIGVVCVGMSNSAQECDDFLVRVQRDLGEEINPSVRFANCAVGGHAIEKWIEPESDDTLWDRCIDDELEQAGIQPGQVRVVYHKAADMFTTDGQGSVLPPYPDPDSDYFNFYDNLTAFSGRVTERLPSVQAVYTTSRSYGGFAGTPARGEPLSFEEGHALNTWLDDHPEVDGVWYGWGPYIWAPSCDTGVTNASDVCYVREDYQADGVHPADGAKEKISSMIHARLSEHDWYRP